MIDKYPFKLRFNKRAIRKWAGRHQSEDGLDVITLFPPQVRERGYYTKSELQSYWKSPRTQSRVAQNLEDYVEAITRTALSTPNESNP